MCARQIFFKTCPCVVCRRHFINIVLGIFHEFSNIFQMIEEGEVENELIRLIKLGRVESIKPLWYAFVGLKISKISSVSFRLQAFPCETLF